MNATTEKAVTEKAVHNVMQGADLSKYVKGAAKTASGNKTHDSNDDIAQRLRGMAIDSVYREAASVLKVPEGELREKYGHLNVGMQRMNLGNRIRGALHAKDKPPKAPKAPKAETKQAAPAKASAGPFTKKAETKKAPIKTPAAPIKKKGK